MKKEIEIFGIKYESMKKAIEAYGQDYRKFWDRLERTAECKLCDLELLASIEDLRAIKIKFVGLDGQARYKVPWAQKYQTTREVIAHERPDLLSLYNNAHPDGKYNPYKKGE